MLSWSTAARLFAFAIVRTALCSQLSEYLVKLVRSAGISIIHDRRLILFALVLPLFEILHALNIDLLRVGIQSAVFDSDTRVYSGFKLILQALCLGKQIIGLVAREFYVDIVNGEVCEIRRHR